MGKALTVTLSRTLTGEKFGQVPRDPWVRRIRQSHLLESHPPATLRQVTRFTPGEEAIHQRCFQLFVGQLCTDGPTNDTAATAKDCERLTLRCLGLEQG